MGVYSTCLQGVLCWELAKVGYMPGKYNHFQVVVLWGVVMGFRVVAAVGVVVWARRLTGGI